MKRREFLTTVGVGAAALVLPSTMLAGTTKKLGYTNFISGVFFPDPAGAWIGSHDKTWRDLEIHRVATEAAEIIYAKYQVDDYTEHRAPKMSEEQLIYTQPFKLVTQDRFRGSPQSRTLRRRYLQPVYAGMVQQDMGNVSMLKTVDGVKGYELFWMLIVELQEMPGEWAVTKENLYQLAKEDLTVGVQKACNWPAEMVK